MQIGIEIIEKGCKRTSYVESSLIDILYEMIKNTYLGYEEIVLPNPIWEFVDNQVLGDFLTYILAYPKNVKTPVVHIQGRMKKIEAQYKSEYAGSPFVCFSGGVDSTGALLHLLDIQKKPIALWCDYGQPYNMSEKSVVEKICHKLDVSLLEANIDVKDRIVLGKERVGHVFPARTLVSAAIAMAFAPSEIVLAGLCDELVVPDKSVRMYDEFTKIFRIPLYSPFIKMTKADVLCIWKQRWSNMLDANDTVSCYSENGNCQNCSSCAKREVAMVASGYNLQYPIVFTNQSKLIEEHWFSRIDEFIPERRTDILIALYPFRDKLTETLRLLVEKNYENYKDEINMRKNSFTQLKDITYG